MMGTGVLRERRDGTLHNNVLLGFCICRIYIIDKLFFSEYGYEYFMNK